MHVTAHALMHAIERRFKTVVKGYHPGSNGSYKAVLDNGSVCVATCGNKSPSVHETFGAFVVFDRSLADVVCPLSDGVVVRSFRLFGERIEITTHRHAA